jgi:DNA primase
LPATPTVRLERDALMAMLQQGPDIGAELMTQAATAEVSDPSLRVVRDAIAAALPGLGTADWFAQVLAEAPEPHQGLIRELALAPLPVPRQGEGQAAAYARDVVVSLLDRDLLALKGQMVARMQRLGDSNSPESRQIQEQLTMLETARRSLRVE